MEAPMVSVCTGSMGSLLRKLTTMEADGKPKGASKAIHSLKAELGTTTAQLQNFATTRPEPSTQAKQWMRQVREMVYDMEDWIDEYHCEDREAPDKHGGGGIAGLVHRMRAGANDEIAKQIGVFTTRIKEANDRYWRYEDKSGSNSGNTNSAACQVPGTSVVHHRLIALHAEETGLVGVDGPKEEIIRLLRRGKASAEKLVSLVGSGGMGKTTLAQQVYCVLQHEFECRAFVSAGRNLPVKTILKGILKQVNRQWKDGKETWDEQKLIKELSGFLTSKKYLIVIDDVWSSSVWQIIRCALPQNSPGSRIVMTTRVLDIACSSCIRPDDDVYKLMPLSLADAKLLFRGRIFGPKGNFPSELEAISDNILQRCGCVPLAIILIAGMLVIKEKTVEQWELVEKSVGSDGNVEVMKKILYHSYIDLPHHLKSCLLYLSIFPEDYVIRKGRLIRRWIAEGFISSRQEIRENCFNELISRSLIQPLPHSDDDSEAGCKVHDVIRDLIISLSAEENFVAVPAHSTSLMPHDRIRRLSLQYSYQGVAPTRPNDNIISYIRSLTIFGCDEEMPSPSKFRYLRVLDLEDSDKMAEQVATIENLFQLKYLGLGGKGMAKLPEQVGKLQHMETLDLRRSDVRELAATALPSKLVHLLVSDVKLPDGMQKMEELQELWTVNVSESSSTGSVQQLGQLKKLRILGVKWCLSDGDSNAEAYRDNFVSALKNLAEFDNLRSLTLDTDEGSSLNFLGDSWSPNLKLTKFKLASTNYYFPAVPKMLASASLPNLAYLEIGVAQVRKDDLKILGGLPSLIILKLRSYGASTKESFEISRNEFPLLQEFWFMRHDGGIKGVVFGNGAMLSLRKLRLQCNLQGAKSLGDFKFGIKNLNCVKQVYVKIDYKDAEVAEVEAAEDAIRKAADVPYECELEFALRG